MIEKGIERFIPKSTNGHSFVQICAILAASLGGFSAGAQFAWPTPSVPQLISNSSYIGKITIEEASYFALIPPLSMLISSFLVGGAMKFIGRKYVIAMMAVPHVVAWILIATAKSSLPIYFSRVLTGISDAISYSTIPVYIAEISTPAVRSRWGNIFPCAVFLGYLSVVVVGVYCHIVTTACIFVFVPLLQVLFIIFLPESPYFLITKGKQEEAKLALEQLRWKESVDAEFPTLVADVERQISESGKFMDLFCISTNRKAMAITIGLRSCQQLCGFPAFVVYVQYIFQLAGAKTISAEVSSIIFFSVLFLSATFASFFVGRCGRRTMLMISTLGCTLSLLLDTIFFYIRNETDIDVSQANWVPLVGMICYIGSFAAGLSFLPTLMAGELFSASIKNIAVFVSSSYLGLTMVVVPKVLQEMLAHFPMYIPFLLFTLACFASTLFCHYCVPETKGKTLEQIQHLLNKGK